MDKKQEEHRPARVGIVQAKHVRLSGHPGAATGPHVCGMSGTTGRRNVGHSSPQQLPQRPLGCWGTSPCFTPHRPPQVALLPLLHERNPKQALSLHSTHQNAVRNGKRIVCSAGEGESTEPPSSSISAARTLHATYICYFKTDLALVSRIETPITFPLLQRNLLRYVSQYRVV